MRALIDTNVVIEREDDHVISGNLQELLRILQKEKIEYLIHPMTLQEIRRDGNLERQKKILSKLKTYPVLESPPVPSKEFLKIIGEIKTPTDEVDNHLLYSVQKDAVDLLITEDRGIRRKAGIVKIEDRVLTIEEATQYFKNLFRRGKIPAMPAITHEPVHNLDVSDPIFDSLKANYFGFDTWFAKISREGRMAFVNRQPDGKLGAISIYKPENEAINDFSPHLPARPRLKICTLKVSRTGFKIGELLVKLAILECILEKKSEIYLTHFMEPDDYLVELIEEYGFIKIAENDKGEGLFLKKLIPDQDEIPTPFTPPTIDSFNRRYFPSFYDGPLVNKFLVPIQPQFHERLFPEKRRIITLDEFMGSIKSEGNTIKKAYICHSQIKQIQPNDLLLFYRSQDLHAITAIGVVDQVHFGLTDPELIFSHILKRTVYTYDEIREIAQKPTLAILFRLNLTFDRPVPANALKMLDIPIPQTIISLNQKNYIEIKRLGGIDEHFTFH